jgi:hypothetical protein
LPTTVEDRLISTVPARTIESPDDATFQLLTVRPTMKLARISDRAKSLKRWLLRLDSN